MNVKASSYGRLPMPAHSTSARTLSEHNPDAELRARAERVIPNGMWGHQRAASLPEGYPQYFASGEGAHVTDVNGNRYIDFMCAWGPIILGHRHELVEAAALSQITAGDCLNGPTALLNLPSCSLKRYPMPTGHCCRRTAPTPRPAA